MEAYGKNLGGNSVCFMVTQALARPRAGLTYDHRRLRKPQTLHLGQQRKQQEVHRRKLRKHTCAVPCGWEDVRAALGLGAEPSMPGEPLSQGEVHLEGASGWGWAPLPQLGGLSQGQPSPEEALDAGSGNKAEGISCHQWDRQGSGSPDREGGVCVCARTRTGGVGVLGRESQERR